MKASIEFDTLEDLIYDEIAVNNVPALLGEAGIGKSSFLKEVAKTLKTKVFVISVNNLAGREDLTGARLVKDEKLNDYVPRFFPHEAVTEAIYYAEAHADETPILFLDEFNRTTPDVTSAIFQLITERRLGSKDLPENLRLVVAGNDVGTVSSVDSASISRLVKFNVVPDIRTMFKKIHDLNPFVKAYLQRHPEQIVNIKTEAPETVESEEENFNADDFFDDESASSFKQIATPRTWESLSKILNRKGIDKSESPKELHTLRTLYNTAGVEENTSLLDILIGAHIGETSAKEEFVSMLEEYINQHDDVEDLDEESVDNFENFNESAAIKKAIVDIKASKPDATTTLKNSQLVNALVWLAKDANAEKFTKPELTMFIQTAMPQLEAIEESELDNSHAIALTQGIQQNEVTKDNKLFKNGMTKQLLPKIPVMRRINQFNEILVSEPLFD